MKNPDQNNMILQVKPGLRNRGSPDLRDKMSVKRDTIP